MEILMHDAWRSIEKATLDSRRPDICRFNDMGISGDDVVHVACLWSQTPAGEIVPPSMVVAATVVSNFPRFAPQLRFGELFEHFGNLAVQHQAKCQQTSFDDPKT